MGFIALILALMLEQLRPLPRDNAVHRVAARVADAIAGATDTGERYKGVIGWCLAVGAAVLSILLAEWVLGAISAPLVLALHVVVLYHTVGFRQVSHAFSEIQLALAANDPEGARQALQRWIQQQDPEFVAGDLPVPELCRTAISHALLTAHRHVFGPLFWYVLLPGAIGPVVYRAARFLADHWARGGHPPPAAAADPAAPAPGAPAVATPGHEPFGWFARQAFHWLDWLPVRLGALGFAIVGNFEDAVYCWRAAAANPGPDSQRRILLLTGGGALGVRLADPRTEAEMRGADASPEGDAPGPAAGAAGGFEWTAAEPDAGSLRSAVGLVWRSVVLWIVLFGMLTIANWLGR